MDEEKLEIVRASRDSSHLQFSLLALSVFTVCTAVAIGLVWSLPDWVAGPPLLLLAAALPAALTSLVIYGDGNLRAFCLGALFPAGIQFVTVFAYLFSEIWNRAGPRFDFFDWLDLYRYTYDFSAALRHIAGLTWGLSLWTGWVSCVTRWFVKNRRASRGGASSCGS